MRLSVRGAVQGVGFRPFVWRLARSLGLAGFVENTGSGVTIEIQGPPSGVRAFLLRIGPEAPPRASIQSLEPVCLDPHDALDALDVSAQADAAGFAIRESGAASERSAVILPDIATCSDCLNEVFDPSDRRYRYPFTNCTNCGPRFTIVEDLPYDRARTSMRRFPMCPACRAEYQDPADRRFHAEPNACPDCGPQAALWDASGAVLAERDTAIATAARAVRAGRIVAVKGVGGFHLVVDAASAEAVRALRRAKRRDARPFAVMAPSLDSARTFCRIDPLEERLLTGPEAPIVLLRRLATDEAGEADDAAVAYPDAPAPCREIAPGNPTLGVMLPYAPLHHLLMDAIGRPVVCTSGNLSDETICTDEREALARLAGIAEIFLVHDRPILRHADDSVVRVMLGREIVLRRARGYAPFPVEIPAGREDGAPATACGAHFKSTVAISRGSRVVLSQHIGDLDTEETRTSWATALSDLSRMHGHSPSLVACDLHPDYASTRHARDLASRTPDAPRVVPVQHHAAHVFSCLADNGLTGPALGVAWDGTGLGDDGTIWGGEFLAVDDRSVRRVAHLRTFRLAGGDAAARDARRSALGVLFEIFGAALFDAPPPGAERLFAAFEPGEAARLASVLGHGLNAPVTSSAGRLFDAASALLGLRARSRFEGDAAMALEFTADGCAIDEAFEWSLVDPGGGAPLVVDWEPAVLGLLRAIDAGEPAGLCAAKVHNTLAEAIAGTAERSGFRKIALTGGCFQNRILTERTVAALRRRGLEPHWHQRVPPNDGGIALGQIVALTREDRHVPRRARTDRQHPSRP